MKEFILSMRAEPQAEPTAFPIPQSGGRSLPSVPAPNVGPAAAPPRTKECRRGVIDDSSDKQPSPRISFHLPKTTAGARRGACFSKLSREISRIAKRGGRRSTSSENGICYHYADCVLSEWNYKMGVLKMFIDNLFCFQLPPGRVNDRYATSLQLYFIVSQILSLVMHTPNSPQSFPLSATRPPRYIRINFSQELQVFSPNFDLPLAKTARLVISIQNIIYGETTLGEVDDSSRAATRHEDDYENVLEIKLMT
ncbi:hypothetical protein EVAR_38325_1 [Eumeta japonica]|uniref:Uncharacterized protein n=1 Tax=Eumeta variegata TaxID=151549 RepID=A0A4C1X544_EUMVA|nr:hypothetical protein EVAR_38325_1 [Eumeta japonica]